MSKKIIKKTKKKTKKQLAEEKVRAELKGIKCVSKDILDLIPFCDDYNSTRVALSGVYIDNDVYAALNSYMGLIVKRGEHELEVNEFPCMDKQPLKVKPMMLHLKSMRTLQRFFGDVSLPILKLGCFFPGEFPGSVKLMTTNLENTSEISYKKIERKFPLESLKELMEKDTKTNKQIKINFDPKLLIKLLNSFKNEKTLTLLVHKDSEKRLAPMLIESKNRQGLIMPLRHAVNE